MPTTADYLQYLVDWKKDLVKRLNEAGCEASDDETFDELIPKLGEAASNIFDKGHTEGYGEGYSIGHDEGSQSGYQIGYTEGVTSGEETGYAKGAKAEYDNLWDVLQNFGNKTGVNYYYKFGYNGWTDDNFNPKYPIICSAGLTPATYVFYTNADITDTKVPIEVLGTSATSMFQSASNLVTIRKLKVHKDVSFSNTFLFCSALENIVFEGVIGQDINFENSTKLTVDSLKSIISALKDYSGTSNEYTHKLTLSSVSKKILEDEGATAPGGIVWSEYVYNKGWNY